jgi:hypothetical protein
MPNPSLPTKGSGTPTTSSAIWDPDGWHLFLTGDLHASPPSVRADHELLWFRCKLSGCVRRWHLFGSTPFWSLERLRKGYTPHERPNLTRSVSNKRRFYAR